MIAKLIAGFALIICAGCNDNQQQSAATMPTPVTNAAPVEPAAQKPLVKSTTHQSEVPQESVVPQGSGFDFYVLSLSWSPQYCSDKGRQGDPQQCRAAKPFGFIVHGLWPQYERGFPESCEAGTGPDRELIRSVSDLTPSAGLIRHEWEKHGSCSGLSAKDYFAVMRSARDKIKIPAQFSNPRRAFALPPQQLETAFIQTNPGLVSTAIAVDCNRDALREIRICLTKSLNFRPCPEVDRAACRAKSVVVAPIP